jgi:hypoxanthine phosphoribosyltransferase
MESIQLKDKKFKINIPAAQIQQQVKRVANEINGDYQGKTPLFIVVLNGAFMFASDLMKTISVDCEITFVKLSSYEGTRSTEKVKQIIGLEQNIEGRDIIVVEDIVDTGITMENLIADLTKMKPASIRISSLLFKPGSFRKDFKVDYIGFEIPNDFIVGYGLDYDELGRNLADIYIITE